MPTQYYFMPGENLTEEQKENNRLYLKQQEELKQKENAERANKTIDNKTVVDFMNVNFQPFEDRILVFPDPVEEKTKGGLYKPNEAIDKVKPVIGTVVAVGPGKAGMKFKSQQVNKYDSQNFTEELPIKPGDRISYGGYAGTAFKLNGIDYLIMRFADCFGKVA